MARNAVKAAIRRWFEDEGFVEVEAAALQVSPGNEAHLHAFSTDMINPDGSVSPMHLHTSPEFACKKLLAAGERRIFDFARVWRNRERGPLHHPEFTLLEWYRAEAPYEALMRDCGTLLTQAAKTTGVSEFVFRGRVMDPFAEPERLTVADAFTRLAGLDLLATILCEYPAAEAALARLSPRDPRVAERFELYACGVELANAFAELTDPTEQRRRFEAEMAEKDRVYGERYPLDEDFLAALGAMPQASGAALGFDRLAMLATGATRIEDVLWTPVAEAP